MSTAVELVRFIGVSHLLQPPVTAYLASPKGLDLRRKIRPDTEDAKLVVENMGLASVALPTALGLLLAFHAKDVLAGGASGFAWLVSAFWCWRLARQFRLNAVWPEGKRKWSIFLFTVFVIQGPLLAAILIANDLRH